MEMLPLYQLLSIIDRPPLAQITLCTLLNRAILLYYHNGRKLFAPTIHTTEETLLLT